MFTNYLKAYLRNLWKNRTYTFLNIIGLAVGITCSTLIFLWVEDEFNWNHQFANKKQFLYQVEDNQTYDGTTYTFEATPGPLAASMKADIPGIANSSHLTWTNRALFSLNDKSLYEEGSFCDASFLSMFNLDFAEGNPATALGDIHSLVISRSMATAIFGATDPLGKIVRMNNADQYTITGVFDDLPENTSFRFHWLGNYQAFYQNNQWLQQWGTNSIMTFVELKPSANPSAINKLLTDYVQTKSPGAAMKGFIFPMSDWRLYRSFKNGKQDASNGRIQYVRIFIIIAWIILIIACINFMNLATASSERRAREVGVRKVLGAGKGKLIGQFIGESLLMAFLAVIVSIGLTTLILPAFNTLVEKQLSLNLLNPLHLAGLLTIGLLCGFLAGSYPSFYLSSFNPVSVLKGLKLKTAGGAVYIRKGLVILQFATSIVFIITTIIIYQQLQYVQHREMGYEKQGLFYMALQGKMNQHFAAIHNDLIHTGYISDAALSSSPVLELGSNTGDFDWTGKDPRKQVLITVENASPQYLSTMGMHLAAGRDFNEIAAQDSNNIIINETLARIITKGNPVGSLITRNDGQQKFRVVGVIKDFVYNDMYQSAAPLILFCDPADTYVMSVRLKANADVPKALTATGQVLKSNNPGYPFEYRFVDEEFENQFKTETLTGRLSGIFAALAIFISCLGLFGLAGYAAERRTKEIGVRKVLGASVARLTGMLSADFVLLVLSSCVLALPIAGLIMHNWLKSYAYRAGINWVVVFALAGAGALMIALLTVSFITIRAALANPIKSLRTE
ncbi:MAG TPA: ABC transporter permease [Puia sp.]|jgi:predicted permease|nr:ABC transporter permease [Puia sp.]